MKKLILHIDDDHEDLELFCEALGQIDPSITCISKSSCKEGLEFLEQEFPDLIFLDINMPVMNGVECLKELRKQEPYSRVPVVMFSTTSNPLHLALFQQLNATFITKPTSYTTLLEILRAIVSTTASCN